MVKKGRIRQYLNWSFQGEEGKWVIVQVPNILLILWLVLTLGARLVDGGTLKYGIALFREAVLFAWSYLEVTTGDSKFRKVLGVTVMAAVIVGFFR